MCPVETLFRQICFSLVIFDIGSALAQSHYYVKIKVDPRLTIQWAHLGYRNEALCTMQCIWTDCPGFKWANQTCYLLEYNQSLPIATRSNGTIIFIREEFIRQEESALVYNNRVLHEYIPNLSPLSGFPLEFPDLPAGPKRIIFDFPWGFHLCFLYKRSCYRWYFGTDDWIPMPSLNVPHFGVLDMIQINQTWWTLGGFWQGQLPNGTASPHRISEYMDEAGHWHTGPKYLDRHFEGLAAISDTLILGVGGAHLPKKLNTSIDAVSKFDVSTGTKTHPFHVTCKMFGTTCEHFASQNGTKMVLCLGGVCPQAQPAFQSSVFIYNMEIEEWAEMPEWEFPEGVRFSNLVRFRGTLYVFGGRYNQTDWNTIFKFNPTKQPAWTIVDTLPDDDGDYSNVRKILRSIVVL